MPLSRPAYDESGYALRSDCALAKVPSLPTWRAMLLALSLIAVLAPVASAQQNPSLRLYTEDHPPRSYWDAQSQQVRGIVADKVSLLMKRAGIAYQIEILPWSRALQVAEAESTSCLFPTTKAGERKHKFIWIGPLHRARRMIFGLASETNPPRSIDEIKGKVIGGYRGSAINDFFLQRGFKVDVANRPADNPRKLLNQRFDYWAVGEETGWQILKEQELTTQIKPLFVFDEVEQYLACNLQSDKKTMEKLQQVSEQAEQDGSYAKIERSYK